MNNPDLFGEAVCRLYETGQARLDLERDDGFRDTEDLSWYLTTYPAFPKYEKRALVYARGRVLDVGCGAGRHSLYLQRRGLTVVGLDASERLTGLARKRGVKDARLGNACGRLPFEAGEFDSVLLFGNNLGFCGSMRRFRAMLSELRRVTSANGSILATSRMPNTSEELHLNYLKRNLDMRRPIGQVRLRLWFDGRSGDWFNLLFFSPTDLAQIVRREGWSLERVFTTDVGFEEAYSVVMEKS